jgi:hypothetical protein
VATSPNSSYTRRTSRPATARMLRPLVSQQYTKQSTFVKLASCTPVSPPRSHSWSLVILSSCLSCAAPCLPISRSSMFFSPSRRRAIVVVSALGRDQRDGRQYDKRIKVTVSLLLLRSISLLRMMRNLIYLSCPPLLSSRRLRAWGFAVYIL